MEGITRNGCTDGAKNDRFNLKSENIFQPLLLLTLYFFFFFFFFWGGGGGGGGVPFFWVSNQIKAQGSFFDSTVVTLW